MSNPAALSRAIEMWEYGILGVALLFAIPFYLARADALDKTIAAFHESWLIHVLFRNDSRKFAFPDVANRAAQNQDGLTLIECFLNVLHTLLRRQSAYYAVEKR